MIVNSLHISKFWNWLLIIILGVCLFLWNKTKTEKDNNSKISAYYINKQKQESETIISAKQSEINQLLQEVKKQKNVISLFNHKIDSIQKLKNKISKDYTNKITEIHDFKSNQLENYFHEELK
jgi:uncharacterized protein HemX